MRAIITLLFWTISMMLPTNVVIEPVIIPPIPANAPAVVEEQEWAEFNYLAYLEYVEEFTALFDSYNYKRSANGRSMINGRFVKMGDK